MESRDRILFIACGAFERNQHRLSLSGSVRNVP